MSRNLLAWGLAVALASTTATAAVPQTIGFSARLVDDATDNPVQGTHQIAFALFDVASGGDAMWQEAREVNVDEGVLFTDVGATTPLDLAIFDGRALWLQVTLDGIAMEPRIALGSVPYAIRAATADAVGGVAAEHLQQRIAGSCSPGNYIIAINADGTVTCAPDLSNPGDVTSVAAGPGLQGGGSVGDITLSLLQTCGLNQVLKWNGQTWVCADDVDTNAGGDITDVLAGEGLTGGGSEGAVTLQVGAGQGITVGAGSVALDTAYTDNRYLNAGGDTMNGDLSAGGFRITGRGCPSGYVRAGTGSALCVERADIAGHTFSSCANRCNTRGAHMCSSAEMRAVLQSGVELDSTPLLNWIDDQVADGIALYVASTSDPADPDAARATSTSGWCRCCTDVE